MTQAERIKNIEGAIEKMNSACIWLADAQILLRDSKEAEEMTLITLGVIQTLLRGLSDGGEKHIKKMQTRNSQFGLFS